MHADCRSPPRRYSPARDPRDYRRRSPSPRRDRAEPLAADTWRRRSPSPAKPTYASNDASGRESGATSRRSSPPPIHPSRAALVDDRSARDAPPARSPFRERDNDRGRDFSARDRERSPPRRRDSPPTGPRGDREFAPPTGPSMPFRNGGENNNFRAPPTGPSGRGYPSPAISPPAGPSGAPSQAPTFPRGNNNPVLGAPTRPRGGGRGGFGFDSGRDFSGPPPRRGSWAGGPRGGGFYGGGGAPSGPRGSGRGGEPFAPPFRGSSNSTATTYPRTMRFRDHLSDLPKEVPGGQKAPDPYERSKLMKLEEDARRLREQIEKKEDEKRMKLREWDALERDAANAQLRVELAETSLRELDGESDMANAF